MSNNIQPISLSKLVRDATKTQYLKPQYIEQEYLKDKPTYEGKIKVDIRTLATEFGYEFPDEWLIDRFKNVKETKFWIEDDLFYVFIYSFDSTQTKRFIHYTVPSICNKLNVIEFMYKDDKQAFLKQFDYKPIVHF